MDVMDIGEQGMRRTVLMETDSKSRFLNNVAEKREVITLLKKERGISRDTCICGRKIEPERLQLNLPNCKICAFGSQFCGTSR